MCRAGYEQSPGDVFNGNVWRNSCQQQARCRARTVVRAEGGKEEKRKILG